MCAHSSDESTSVLARAGNQSDGFRFSSIERTTVSSTGRPSAIHAPPSSKRSDFERALDFYDGERIGAVSISEFRVRTEDDPFAGLITAETLKAFEARGLLHELLPFELPVYRLYLDLPTFPCIVVSPTLEDLEMIEAPEERAEAIRLLRLAGHSEREKTLILSVAGTCFVGDVVQGNLLPPEPQRRLRPCWWKPRQPRQPDPFEPDLFDPKLWED